MFEGIFFSNCRNVSFVVPVFKIAGERSVTKTEISVRTPSLFGKIFEKFLNNRFACSW